MLQQKAECPQANILEVYLSGCLPPRDIESCERHIAACPICGDTIRGLGESADDTFNRLASEVMAEPPAVGDKSDEQAIENLIARLKNIPPEPSKIEAARIAEDRAAEVQRLLEPSETPAVIGRIARYDLLNLLGAGSTGVVYEAFDLRLERIVALKILRPSLGPAARERFIAEARAAAAIDHPNIVSIYEVDHDGPLAYMAMQRLPGQTLESRLEQVTFLPETQVRMYTRQIADGLSAAHKKNLIHRDIKPANIWINADSNQLKILDFGLARIADSDPQLTGTGMLAGTPSYMSPEQTRGLELDRRSDLFSLGCLMYRAVTGRLPFSSTGILATLQAIQNDSPPLPAQLNPVCSTEFSDLIMTLLEKQPAGRPDSATQLIEALDHPRDAWPFIAKAISEPLKAQSETKRRSVATKQSSTRRSSFVGWSSAAILLTCLGFGGYFFGADIIRIATNQGELIVETDDPSIKVEVLQNGQVVRVIDTSTDDRIDISAGEYSVRPASTISQFDITPTEVKLQRGGREIVRVRKSSLDSTKPSELGVNTPSTATPAESTFDGRTFEEWLTILRVERNSETICTAINSVTEMSLGNKTMQAKAVAAITPIVRRYQIECIRQPRRLSGYEGVFTIFFRSVEPEVRVEFTLGELREGTNSSRQFVWRMSNGGSLFDSYDAESATANFRELQNNAGIFFETTVEFLRQDPKISSTQTEFAILITSDILKRVLVDFRDTANKSQIGTFPTTNGNNSELQSKILEAFRDAKSIETKAAYGLMLSCVAPESPQLAHELVGIVLDAKAPMHVRAFAFWAIDIMVPKEPAEIVPALLTLVQNTTDRLPTGENESLLRFCFPMYTSDGFNQNNSVNDWPVRPKLILKTVQFFTHYGPVAKDAIPWLESLTNDKSLLDELSEFQRANRSGQPTQILLHEVKIALAEIRPSREATEVPQTKTEETQSELVAKTPTNSSTYNGRTFPEWIELLKTERKTDTICEGLEAMAELSRDDAESQDIMLAIMTPLIRLYGSNTASGGNVLTGPANPIDKFHVTFLRVFSTLPPERLVEFSLAEMSEGTKQSRRFLFWLHMIGSVYEHDEIRQKLHVRVLKDSISRYADKLIELVTGDADVAGERAASALKLVADLVQHLFGSNQPYLETSREPVDLTKEQPELVAKILTAYQSSTTDESKALFGLLVAITAPDTPDVAKEMCRIIVNKDVVGNRRAFAFHALKELAPRNGDIVVPTLLELANHREKYFSTEDETKFKSSGTTTFREYEGLFFAGMRPRPLEFVILDLLSLYQKSASAAIPWLENLANQTIEENVGKNDSRRLLKSQAEELLQQIKDESAK